MAIQAAQLVVEVGADTGEAERKISSFGSQMGATARKLGGLSLGLSAAVTLPALAAAGAIFKVGSSFDSAFTGVIKTVDATEAQIADLRQGILEMSTELPTSANAIADVAAAAGQLGIATENILGFTRVMIDLGETTNLSADEAATSFARFANVTGMAQTDMDRLGSTVVSLGNNLATTEAEIVSMAMRLAGAGSQIGLTEAQIFGFAGALSSVGIEAEAGGSAFSRVMIDMASSVATGGTKLTQFARVAGMSASGFADSFEEDAAGALASFIEGLGQLSAEGANVFAILDEMGLADIRVRDALLRASGAGDLFRRSLRLANEAWEENTALTKEAALRYGTTGSRLEVLRNQFSAFGITLYSQVSPGINQTISFLTDFVTKMTSVISAFIKANPKLFDAALAFAAIVVAAGPILGVLAGVAGGLALLGSAAAPILGVVAAVAALGAAFAGDLGGVRTLLQENVLGPIQAVIAEIQRVAALPAGVLDIGPVTVTWTPSMTRIKVGEVISGTWIPQFANIKIGEIISGTWSPSVKRIDLTGSVISGFIDISKHVLKLSFADVLDVGATWTPKFKSVSIGDVVSGTWMPKFTNIRIGEIISGTWSPAVKRIDLTNALISGTIDLTSRIAKITFGDLLDISGSVGADGRISVLFTRDDFTFDLAQVHAMIKAGITGLVVEVKNAWSGAGWAGVGQLAKEKIDGIGQSIGTALTGLGQWVTTGLLFAAFAVGAEVRSLFAGEGLTFVDTSVVTDWAKRNIGKIRTALDTAFGDDNIISKSIDKLTGTVSRIADGLSGFADLSIPDQFSTGINLLLTAMQSVSSVSWDAVGLAGPALTELATGVLGFANAILSGIDTKKIAHALGSAATNISLAIDKFVDPEQLGELGAAVGSLAGTIVGKFGELVSTPGFAKDLGTSLGSATGALLVGAIEISRGVATQLASVDWNQFSGQIQAFAGEFVSALFTAMFEAVKDYTIFGQAGEEQKARIQESWLDAILFDLGLQGPVTAIQRNIEQGRQREGPPFDIFGFTPELKIPGPGFDPAAAWEGPNIPVPVTPTMESGGEWWGPLWDAFQKALRVPMFGAVGAGGGLTVPVTPTVRPGWTPDDLSKTRFDTEWPVSVVADPISLSILKDAMTGFEVPSLKTEVQVIDIVVPENIPPVKAPIRVIRVDVPSNVKADLWATASGIGSAISEAASSIGVTAEAPRFDWPDLPEWKWPEYLSWQWPEYPSWQWPSIPRPGWLGDLRVPRPGWIGELLSWSPEVVVRMAAAPTIPGQLAHGTSHWRGGLTWVGEEGPELVSLPRGSRVFNSQESREMVEPVTVNVYATLDNDIDVNEMAYRIADIIKRRSG
jgi:TP901 family phage tail tape measure protein